MGGRLAAREWFRFRHILAGLAICVLTTSEFCAIDVYEWARLVSQPTGLSLLVNGGAGAL